MLKRIMLSFVLTLALSACGGNSAPVTKITVTMKEFTFEPAVINGTADVPVEITLVNEGAIEHDFVIESIPVEDVSTQGASAEDDHMSDDHVEFDLHTSTAANATSILRFTPTQPGIYKIICSVPGHLEAGMTGELIVK